MLRAGGPDGEGFTSALNRTVRHAAGAAARPAAGAGAEAALTSGRFDVLDSLEGEAAEAAGEEAGPEEEEETSFKPEEEEKEEKEEAGAPVSWLLDMSIMERSAEEVIGEVLEAAARGPRRDPPLPPVAWSGLEGDGAALDMGPSFSMLPADALHAVLSRLPARDVAALGATCRGLQAACSVGTLGTLWRDRLRRAYPHSPLHADTPEGWHIAFLLEVGAGLWVCNCVVSPSGRPRRLR